MTLKECTGKYKGNTKIKFLLSKINVSIEVDIHENGTINASYNAGIKKGSTTMNFDPNSEVHSITISGMNIPTVFNKNNINITLPNKISGFKVIQTNVTLVRC